MAGLNPQEDPDYFMMHYHPYRQGQGNQDMASQTLVYLQMRNVYDQQRRDAFIQRIQQWLRERINDIVAAHPGEAVIFGFVPGHLPREHQNFHESFMVTELNIGNLNQDPHFAVDPNMLLRAQAVESQAAGGQRNIQNHLDSVEVRGDVKGKIVCIMDDVWTTGCTMNACSQLVTEAEAKKVYTLVIGRTVHD